MSENNTFGFLYGYRDNIPRPNYSLLFLISLTFFTAGILVSQYFMKSPTNVDIDEQAEYCVENIEKILMYGYGGNFSAREQGIVHNWINVMLTSKDYTIRQAIGMYFNYGGVSRMTLKMQIKNSCLDYKPK